MKCFIMQVFRNIVNDLSITKTDCNIRKCQNVTDVYKIVFLHSWSFCCERGVFRRQSSPSPRPQGGRQICTCTFHFGGSCVHGWTLACIRFSTTGGLLRRRTEHSLGNENANIHPSGEHQIMSGASAYRTLTAEYWEIKSNP